MKKRNPVQNMLTRQLSQIQGNGASQILMGAHRCQGWVAAWPWRQLGAAGREPRDRASGSRRDEPLASPELARRLVPPLGFVSKRDQAAPAAVPR